MPNTREKLIELLEQSLNNDGTGREMRFVGGDVVPAVLSAIANGICLEEKQATSDETSKWIPVTERLPKPCATEPEWSETVLFRTITGRLYSGYRNQGILPTSFYDDGWYPPYWMDESEQIEVEDEYVTHWMPLPSLPKGE